MRITRTRAIYGRDFIIHKATHRATTSSTDPFLFVSIRNRSERKRNLFEANMEIIRLFNQASIREIAETNEHRLRERRFESIIALMIARSMYVYIIMCIFADARVFVARLNIWNSRSR